MRNDFYNYGKSFKKLYTIAIRVELQYSSSVFVCTENIYANIFYDFITFDLTVKFY